MKSAIAKKEQEKKLAVTSGVKPIQHHLMSRLNLDITKLPYDIL